MAFLVDLWLPILLSAVFVFLASSVFHMMLPWHIKDWSPLPDEEGTLAAMRTTPIPPGEYFFPHCKDMKEWASEETMERMNRGPVGFMTIYPNGPMAMGKNLRNWFLYCLLNGVFVAYITSLAYGAGADGGEIFRMTSTVGVLAYAIGVIPNSIWKGVAWTVTGRFLVDGTVYGLVTAATFRWLWPELG